MALNIKNEETYRLARTLAEKTGESLTAAVTQALRDRLASLEQADARVGMADRIMAIAADMRARLPDDFFDIEHGDLLYDDDGLPK